MDDITGLLQALDLSPDNIPLRLHVAKAYLNRKDYPEAETHLKQVLAKDANQIDALELLLNCYYEQEKYSLIIVMMEERLQYEQAALYLWYIRALYKDGSEKDASAHYRALVEHQPDFRDEMLDEAFSVKATPVDDGDWDEEEENQPGFGLSMPGEQKIIFSGSDISFKDIGGMDFVKKQIDMKILKPMLHPDLFKKYGKKIGGGILLYGPPGCGKTHIAKATAGEMNAKFINISMNDVLSQWMGETEKNLNRYFEAARNNTPCVIFIDEIDAIGGKRADMKNSGGGKMVNQLLSELDGFGKDNEGVLVIAATNVPWHTDPAMLRPGRFDRLIFVPPPDQDGKEAIYKIHLQDKPLGKMDYAKLAKSSKSFSGADIQAVIDKAIELKLEEALEKGEELNLENKDILKQIKGHQPVAVSEWLKTARNYAVYANESGLYNEVVEYLKGK